MTVWVLVDGELVDRDTAWQKRARCPRSDFPSPGLQRFEPYRSPVTGAPILSQRARERDLNQSNSVDPRDFPRDHKFSKGRAAAGVKDGGKQREPAPFKWR